MSDEDLLMWDQIISIDEEENLEREEEKKEKSAGASIACIILWIVLIASMINACVRL